MTPPLADAWAKWSRAKSHTEAVRSETIAFIKRQGNTAPFDFEGQFDAKAGAFVWHVTRVDQMPVSWGLMVGDALTNFRASLDYLAWHLVQIGSVPNPPHDGRNVYFPINRDEGSFNSSLKNRLPGVDKYFVAMVENFQPYRQWPKDPKLHALWFLSELSRHDKHRQVQLAFARNLEVGITFDEVTGFQVQEISSPGQSGTGVIQPCTEMLRIAGRPIPGQEPKIKLGLQGAFTIAFEDGRRVSEVLTRISNECGTILTAFEPLL